MEFKPFKLENRKEIEQFDVYISEYVNSKTGLNPSNISLVDAYDFLQSRSDGGKVFTALLDIQVSFIHLFCDRTEVHRVWNSEFTTQCKTTESILDSESNFFGKMEIHRYNTSFVLRYRAIWDKIMGLLILIYRPDKYDKFCKARSRLSKFKNLALEIDALPNELVRTISEIVTDFNNDFRTAEAHNTGVLRKYTFSMDSIIKSPELDLGGYWTALNHFIKQLGKLFVNN